GELPGLELPGLLDADARLMEQRVAGAVHAAVDRVVEVAVRVVDAADDGRARVAADQAERAAEVPAAPELVAAHQRQDVRLVVVEEAPGGAVVVALAARQRVRDEAERASCRVELAQHLEAVDAPLAAVDEQRVAVGADAVDLEIGQALVEAFQAEGTGPAERLLDAEAVVLRTAEAEVRVADRRHRFAVVGRLGEQAGTRLQRGLVGELEAGGQPRVDRAFADVAVVVDADARHQRQAIARLDDRLEVAGRAIAPVRTLERRGGQAGERPREVARVAFGGLEQRTDVGHVQLHRVAVEAADQLDARTELRAPLRAQGLVVAAEAEPELIAGGEILGDRADAGGVLLLDVRPEAA